QFVDVVGNGGDLGGPVGAGQLVAVDDDVDAAAAQQVGQLLEIALDELGLAPEALGQRVHHLDLEADKVVGVVRRRVDVGAAALLVAAPAEGRRRVRGGHGGGETGGAEQGEADGP